MSKIIQGLVGVLTLGFAFAVQAGGTLADPAASADWNADSTWSGGAKPVAGEAVMVLPTGDITLTMSADSTNDYASLYFRSSVAKTTAASLTFDGRGYKLLMPYSANGYYVGAPFKILDADEKEAFKLDDSKLDAADKIKAAPILFDDARFKISQDTAGAVTFRMDSGTLNACNPAGTAYALREILMSNGSQPFRFELVNGAKAVFPKLYAGYTKPGSMLFDNAELTVHGALQFGRDNYYYSESALVLAATNTTFVCGGAVGFYHTATNVFKDCTIDIAGEMVNSWNSSVTFENCTLTATNTLIISAAGNNGEPAEMTFDGGTYSFGYPQIGFQSNSDGKMTVKGGAVVDYVKSGSSQGQHIGWRGTGVIDVVSGTFRTPRSTYCQLYVGKYADTYGTGWGRLNVHDSGKVEIRMGTNSWAAGATDGLAVGGGGHGEVHVYGGEIIAPRINVGFETTALTTTSFIHQVGGRVSVNTLNDAKYSRVALMAYSGAAGGHWNDRDIMNRAAYVLDGGVFEAARILGGKGSQSQGGSGHSRFSANGGTFRQNMNPSTYASMEGLDVAEFGSRGLVFDSNGHDVKIAQNLINKPGESGLFVKTGRGTLTYAGECSVSNLVVSNGTWQLDAGATVSSALRVVTGGTFSLVGDPTSATLASLAVTNATIALDPGDTITVQGNASFKGLRLVFSSAPAMYTAQTVFVVQGTLDDTSVSELQRAFCDVALADGTHAQFQTATEGGVTSVTVTIEDNAEPIGADATLTWTGSGLWANSGNWTPNGMPDADKKAAFTSTAAGKTVTVDSAAVAGALSFGADGYSLTGSGSVEIAGAQGAAQIVGAAGVNTVSVPMTFNTLVEAPIAAGAAVNLDGDISHGGILKTGDGMLALRGDNTFDLDVRLAAGTTLVGSDGALGPAESAWAARVQGGTLAFDADGNINLARPVTFDTSAMVVIDARTNATATLDVTAGGKLVKRGAGTLTVPLTQNIVWDTSNLTGGQDYTEEVSFNADGTATVTKAHPIMIVEGGLVIRSADGTPKTLTTRGNLIIGEKCTTATTSPELTLDGVQLITPLETTFGIGYCNGSEWNANTLYPKLTLVNGASVKTHNFTLGNRCRSGAVPTLAMTNATITTTYALYLNGGANGSEKTVVRAKDSTLLISTSSGKLHYYGAADHDFDNCMIDTTPSGGFELVFSYGYNSIYPSGEVRFRNGSVFRAKSVNMNGVYTTGDGLPFLRKPFTLVFDNATWDYGASDITITSTVGAETNLFIRTTGGGIKLNTPSGTMFATDSKVIGDGGIAKTGAGTLKFGNGSYAFTGTCDIEEGTVNLSVAGMVTNAVFGGSGTVSGGTLRDTTIIATIAENGTVAATPLFENCAFVGRTDVDLGRSENPLVRPYPQDVVVAHYTGTVPDVSRWRVTGTGVTNLRGTFTAEGGVIRMSLNHSGFTITIK
ncbi:MAG TPA: hypothetical protein P5125_01480 [Kiritimatiellia bacterium]|jgi:autotransporter-associated beta strand protein|nr:hypothetical protein [Candidatus Latescibacterota bacterium]HOR97647.1 hypothetical protein [Kiritimatiellia bacterium]HPK76006.1 hypothetical protein [Candidatus Latescibacterota bacterium]HRU19003.1 hypothetical protein [Kiritimatiellia bacterium]